MKKIITLLILTGLVSVSVMAGETRKLEKTPFTDWTFGTSVETRAGYNLDSKLFGLKGSTVVNLSATFYDQATTFEEDMSQKVRGKIVVHDLEVKVATGDKSHDYASTGVLNVNWESVTAWVYFGPSLYIKMGDINSHEVRYVGSIADGDFSVIKYSILTPFFTGGRLGRKDYDPKTGVDDDADKKRSKTDAKSQTIENVSIVKDNLNTFAIGFDIPKMFKTELGFATKLDYFADNSKDAYEYYNTFNINAMTEIYAMEEKFKFKVKADAVAGNKTDAGEPNDIDNGLAGITTNGNPLTVGGSISYTHALGKYNIVPAIGVEMQFEEKRKINPDTESYAFKTGAYNVADKSALTTDFLNKKADGGYFSKMTTPYEVGFGLAFNWKSLGKSKNRSFEGLAKGDVGTTDGVSLSGFVGSAPYSPIPDIAMPYYGVQLSFWDSEEDGLPGIIPGLSFGIIGNVNIAPGGKHDLKEYANNGRLGTITEYETYELTLGNRVDAGVGTVLRTKKLLGKIQPYTGFVYKFLDLTGEREVLTTKTKDVDDKTEYSAYVADRYTTASNVLSQRTDMRVKFGIDITITPKVSLNGEWASGNLAEGTLTKDQLNRAYDSYDYFENADADGNPMAGSDARAGVVSVGLKVAF